MAMPSLRSRSESPEPEFHSRVRSSGFRLADHLRHTQTHLAEQVSRAIARQDLLNVAHLIARPIHLGD